MNARTTLTRMLTLVTMVIFTTTAALAQEQKQEETKPAPPKKPAWHNKLELSYVTTSGNTDNDTFASKFESKFEKGGNRIFINSRLIVQSSSGKETANQFRATGRYERKFGSGLFALLESGFNRDRFSGYDYRWSAGPGLGYDFIDSDNYSLKVYGAAVYYYDKLEADDMDTEEYLSVQATADVGAKLNSNLEISNEFDFSISTQDDNNYFINNEIGARVRINSGLAVGLSYIARYENQPPTSSLEKLNTTFLTSLVLSF